MASVTPVSLLPFAAGNGVHFLEATVANDQAVAPQLLALDKACRNKTVSDGWLEEQLRDVLGALLLSQCDHRSRAARLQSARTATRDELYRRLCRGRDFVRAAALRAPTLTESATVACLSPYHFQRNYTVVFGESPFATMQNERLNQAHRLLQNTDFLLTEVAASIGYESYSAFHAAFRQRFGCAPRTIRKKPEAATRALEL
jgi:AraC family transcriptional regulator